MWWPIDHCERLARHNMKYLWAFCRGILFARLGWASSMGLCLCHCWRNSTYVKHSCSCWLSLFNQWHTLILGAQIMRLYKSLYSWRGIRDRIMAIFESMTGTSKLNVLVNGKLKIYFWRCNWCPSPLRRDLTLEPLLFFMHVFYFFLNLLWFIFVVAGDSFLFVLGAWIFDQKTFQRNLCGLSC